MFVLIVALPAPLLLVWWVQVRGVPVVPVVPVVQPV